MACEIKKWYATGLKIIDKNNKITFTTPPTSLAISVKLYIFL